MFTSAGATGSVRLHTSTAALVPSALPASEEDVGTTCATKVSNQAWFSFQDVKMLPAWGLHLCPSVDSQRSETEDMNEVEKPQVPLPPRTTAKPTSKPKPSAPKKPVSPPRVPSSNTPSNTYLGSYKEWLKIIGFHIFWYFSSVFFFLPCPFSSEH